ncbi:hypothetical protein [Streptomyces sp. CB02400]|nr:hypothetical protein [Streptomyces sp. CB02400]
MSLPPLLAACGTDADANAGLKKQYLLENAIAACMKKQGFTYTVPGQ